MKFLAISGDKVNNRVVIFDSAFRALNYQSKHKNVKIKRVANWKYRLVRTESGKKSEIFLDSYKKAIKLVKKELGTLNDIETKNCRWLSHDARRITYELTFVETKPFSSDIIKSYSFQIPEKPSKAIKNDGTTPLIGKNKVHKKWSTKKKVAVSLATTFGLTLAVLGTIVGVKTDWQMLADEMKASDYVPSDQIIEITDTLRLTRKGKSIFYATHPQLQNKGSFNMRCGSDGQGAYTLGCYYKDGENDEKEHISIYNTEVDEIREKEVYYNFVADRNVTTLHEILHAAYDRLSKEEQVDMCGYARIIVSEIDGLSKSLEIYSDEHFCTEAFARIGSEYIVGLTGFDYEYAEVNRDKLSDKAKFAADMMAAQYKKYFSYNEELYVTYQYNQHIESALVAFVKYMHDDLAIQRTKAMALISAYYSYPSYYNYILADTAVSKYKSNYQYYLGYYKIYLKITYTLDSESPYTLADI